ncbi:hypothetical protein ASE72_02115 [Sphingomonas sp. Leaf20]|nr:hypothetical protein ASE72_02115 [Sphingomonas sp. Leaf20]
MWMMNDREVWLKAMAIVEVHGTMEAAPIVDTILDVLGDEPHKNDWARVAAAVDVILEGQAQ